MPDPPPGPTAGPTCTVHLFFPRRPENFAYIVHKKFVPDTRLVRPGGGPAERVLDGYYVTLTDIPTLSARETLPDWFVEFGCTLVHDDGRPYTDEELDARRPDPQAVNGALRKVSMRRLSFI